MSYPDLRSFLSDLGTDLVHVNNELDPRFEVAAALRQVGADDPALLFENLKGYPGVRAVGNVIGSRARMARMLDTSEDRLTETYLERKARGIAPVMAGDGGAPVKEVVHIAPGELLDLLPILTHYEKDAAPFITSGVVLCRDPVTGRRGMGIHRMMVKGGRRLGIFLANPPLSLFHANAEARGKPLEVAVALGVDPAILVAAVVKAPPESPDKMDIAGALRGAPVDLVRAETVDVDVPARAEIVIEGWVLPGVREVEGPFGENTGYYFANTSPVFEATAVTHRRDPIYPGLCPWTADVDMLLSLAAGAELLGQLQGLVRGVTDLELIGGTIGFSAVIAVRNCPRHEARRLIHLALNLDRRLKSVTVVDDDVNVRDPREVSWALATRFCPERDTLILHGTEGYVIDPSVGADGVGSKLGLVATRGEGPAFDKVTTPAAAAEKAAAVMRALRAGQPRRDAQP